MTREERIQALTLSELKALREMSYYLADDTKQYVKDHIKRLNGKGGFLMQHVVVTLEGIKYEVSTREQAEEILDAYSDLLEPKFSEVSE